MRLRTLVLRLTALALSIIGILLMLTVGTQRRLLLIDGHSWEIISPNADNQTARAIVGIVLLGIGVTLLLVTRKSHRT